MPECEVSWLLGQLRVSARVVNVGELQSVDIPQDMKPESFYLGKHTCLHLVLSRATLTDPLALKA